MSDTIVSETLELMDSTIVNDTAGRWADFKRKYITETNITNIIIRNWSITCFDKVSYRLWYISVDIDGSFAGGASFLSSCEKDVSIQFNFRN